MPSLIKRPAGLKVSVLFILSALAWAAIPAAAQTTTVPDLSQFGYPRVTATGDFTPGQATTIVAGNQKVDLPADFMSKPVKFEFLEGDASTFAPRLAPEDQSKQILAAFAFRVTDTATGQLVGRFDKPVMYSITDSRVTAESEVYNTSAANPPNVTENSTPPTIAGTTLSHAFGGASVGWLSVSPPMPVGMPATGAGQSGFQLNLALLAVLMSLALFTSGALILRRATHRA